MRLKQLDLLRYGKFADTTLDFGPAPSAESCDVSIVYGPNEAGKSTAFAGWLDLLFGIPLKTPNAFKFPRKDLLIGATLETASDTLHLHRNAQSKTSLQDAAGRMIAEHRMTVLLHGLDRDAYRTQFSLDDAVLREGGAEIARAQGDLGQLLHAGASGLSGLSDALASLEAEIDAFHKKGGRSTKLALAKTALKDLDARLKTSRVDPRQFERLRTELVSAQEAFDSARTSHKQALIQVKLRTAAELRHGLNADITRLNALLKDMPKGPALPPNAGTQLAALAEKHTASLRAQSKAQEDAQAARTALENTPEDAKGLSLASLLEDLEALKIEDGKPLLAAVQSGAPDLPRRITERKDLDRQITETLNRFPSPSPKLESLNVPEQSLRALAHSAQDLADANRDLKQAQDTLGHAQQTLGPAVEAPRGLDALQEALSLMRHDRVDLAQLDHAAQSAQLAGETASIGLPVHWPNLLAPGLPEEAELIALARQFETASLARDTARQRQKEQAETQAEAAAHLSAAEQHGEAVSAADTLQSRKHRDAAWARHIADLTSDSAQVFEQALRADDLLQARFVATTEARARLTRLSETLQVATQNLQRRTTAYTEATQAHTQIQETIDGIARQLGLAPGTQPDSLRTRRSALAKAAQAQAQAKHMADQAQAAHKARAALHHALSEALVKAGVSDPDPERLVHIAEQHIRDLSKTAEAARTYSARLQQLDTLRHAITQAKAQQTEAQACFETTAQPLWCAGESATHVLAQLPLVRDIAVMREKKATVTRRVTLLQAALSTFAPYHKQIADLLGADLDIPVQTLLLDATQRAKVAQSTQRARAAQSRALSDAQTRLSEAQQIARTALGKIDVLFAGQTRDAGDDVMASYHRLHERDTKVAQLAQTQADYDAAGAGFDPAALVREETDADPARLDSLTLEANLTEDRMSEASRAHGRAEEELRAAQDAAGGADLDQQRATLLETLRADAQASAAKLLGLMAARAALLQFRQTHRGDMLKATERAFSTLTRGEWQKLDTLQKGKSDQLVALRGDEMVGADAMSTGTRGQLYLALRIAGHETFVTQNGPLPFVMDDILETFDDARAGAALDLAADMGQRGQVILFTHHAHLVRLAQTRIPTLRVLNLAENLAPSA